MSSAPSPRTSRKHAQGNSGTVFIICQMSCHSYAEMRQVLLIDVVTGKREGDRKQHPGCIKTAVERKHWLWNFATSCLWRGPKGKGEKEA